MTARQIYSPRPSIPLKISPQDRLKLMSLPPAQRREHIRLALLIWAGDLLEDRSLTVREITEIFKTITGVLSNDRP